MRFPCTGRACRGRAPGDLGVAYTRTAEDAAEEMRPSSRDALDHPRAADKVGLQLLAGSALHPPERQITSRSAAPREAIHRLVSTSKPVVAEQILVNPHRGQPLVYGRFNRIAPGPTTAQAPAIPGGHFGWSWSQMLPRRLPVNAGSRPIRRADQSLSDGANIEF